MPTFEQINRQIESLHVVSKGSHLKERHIKELTKILHEDEQVEGFLRAYRDHVRGLLVATNKRVLFIDRGDRLAGVRVVDFPYDRISSIGYGTGLVFASITIFGYGNKTEFNDIMHQSQARAFAEHVRARATAPSAPKTAPSTSPPIADDTVSKLERLAELKAKGVLTEEEFAQQKKKILGD